MILCHFTISCFRNAPFCVAGLADIIHNIALFLSNVGTTWCTATRLCDTSFCNIFSSRKLLPLTMACKLLKMKALLILFKGKILVKRVIQNPLVLPTLALNC